MTRCVLDILPVELFHALFSYFLAHEILLTFTSVSPYIDAVLVSYTNYRVDFKSILKIHFDLVCRTIKADQIISLRLSGLDDTPKQCQLFFTHFRIEHISSLRSLRLINIDKQLMKDIVHFIDKLNPDCQISLDDCDIHTLISSPVIRQLTRLRITDSKQFAWTNWSDLLSLSMERSSITTFQYICQNAPKLQSLDICLENNGSNIALAFQVPQLTRLVLKVEGSLVTMNQMEQILTTLPGLKHLELHTACSLDLIDGFRWENVSGCLVTLNFFFIVNLELVENILDSFRTWFWLGEKRWFVAYDRGRFFSIPRFADTSATMDFYPFIHSTAIDENIFFNHITELESSKSPTSHYFPKVRTLKLNDITQFETLFDIVPMSKVTHVILSGLSSTNLTSTAHYLFRIPHLHTLSITSNLSDFLEYAQKIRFEQIRTLTIDMDWRANDKHRVRQLCQSFPFVERLRVTSTYSSIFVVHMIDGFKHLSNASFMCSLISEIQRNDWSIKPEWAIYGARRLKIDRFTCQFSNPYIYAWIDEQPPQSTWFFYWWERRDYLQHRLQQNLQRLRRFVNMMFDCVSEVLYTICHSIWYMMYYSIYYAIFFGYWKFIAISLADMSIHLRSIYTCILLLLSIFTFVSPSKVRWIFRVIVFSTVIVILDIMLFVATGNWNALIHHQVGMLFCEYKQSTIGKSFAFTPAVYIDIHRFTYNYLNNTFICTERYNMILWCLGIITLPFLAFYSFMNDILYASLKTIQSIAHLVSFIHINSVSGRSRP